MVLSLCSSYLTAETSDNLQDLYQHNGSNMIMTQDVFNEISNEECDAFHCGDSADKYEISLNIVRADNTDATRFPELLHERSDKSLVLVALDYDGIVSTADYHVAANARYLTVPYIFKIPEKELGKYNGPGNYRLIHIKKINNLLKEIKNKKI